LSDNGHAKEKRPASIKAPPVFFYCSESRSPDISTEAHLLIETLNSEMRFLDIVFPEAMNLSSQSPGY
jgi:hypothetical protein